MNLFIGGGVTFVLVYGLFLWTRHAERRKRQKRDEARKHPEND